MRAYALALLTSTAVLFPLTSSAQSVNDEGARALEAQVPALMDTFLQSAPEVRYTFQGDVQAVPSGDSYSLSIPPIDFDFAGEAETTLSAFPVEVTPLENGWNRAEWDFPNSITVTNPRRASQQANITFSSEGNSMTVAPEYGMALQADYGFDDIRVTVSEGTGSLSIDDLQITVDSEQSGDGSDSYNSDTQLSVADVLVDVPDEDVRIELASLSMGGTSQRQRLDLFAILQETLSGLDPESEAFALAYIDVLRATADEKWIGAANFQSALEGLDVLAEGTGATVGLIEVALDAEGLDEAQAQLGLAMTAQDIASPELPAMFADVIPTFANLDLQAVDIPIQDLSQEAYGMLGEAPSDEDLFGPKGRRAGVGNPFANLQDVDPMVFLGLILNSDVQLLLQNVLVEAPIGYIAAQGVVDPDPQAAFQAVANIELDIAGLPEMIAFAQSMGGDAAQAAGLASALSAMGRDGTDEEGVAIKEFDLEVTSAGQVLLNGNDMSAMMGMFQ
ncbi:MAG: hypothetical protein AB8B88_12990 [Devosiaceae bacterium]